MSSQADHLRTPQKMEPKEDSLEAKDGPASSGNERLEGAKEESEEEKCEDTPEEKTRSQVYDAQVEYFVDLTDGTDFNLGHEPWKMTVSELQAKLRSLGKPALSDDKVDELRESGWVKEEGSK